MDLSTHPLFNLLQLITRLAADSAGLDDMFLRRPLEVDGIQDSYHPRVKSHDNVPVVVRTILQRCNFALASLENVDRAWLLARTVVNHHVRAAFAIQTREEELLRNYLKINIIISTKLLKFITIAWNGFEFGILLWSSPYP